MVHRQKLFRELLATVVTETVSDLLLPPLSAPELLGLGAFALDVFGVGKPVKHALVYHGNRVLETPYDCSTDERAP